MLRGPAVYSRRGPWIAIRNPNQPGRQASRRPTAIPRFGSSSSRSPRAAPEGCSGIRTTSSAGSSRPATTSRSSARWQTALTETLYGARWTLLDTVGRSREWRELVVAAYRAAADRGAFDIVHSESTSVLPLVHAHVRPPIVVKYHGNYVGLVRAQAKRAFSRPRTVLHEALSFAWLTRLHFRRGSAWAFRRCVSMVPSRQQVHDTARSHFIPLDLMHVVPNGVDVALFAPGDKLAARRELGLGDELLLTSVGRLNDEKGFDVALEMLGRIAEDHSEARLVIVGDGEERARLEDLARQLGVAGRVDFVGGQPPATVVRYLIASDVFLFPTRRDEAGPLVVPEAMACGLPLVASRIGGVAEVLDPPDGEAVGLLVAPGSVADLEQAVRRLLSDPRLRASLGAAARVRAVREYSVETMIERTVAVYRIGIARAGLGDRPRGSGRLSFLQDEVILCVVNGQVTVEAHVEDRLERTLHFFAGLEDIPRAGRRGRIRDPRIVRSESHMPDGTHLLQELAGELGLDVVAACNGAEEVAVGAQHAPDLFEP